MITNFINDKKMILNFFNFMFLFITSAFLIVMVCLIIFFIVFECKKYKCLYYFIIAFVNLMLLLALWEIVLSGLFQAILFFCRESPRVMKFIFTEDYIINGNTENYPPKFGYKDPIQTELFSECLNGGGDLFQKFVSNTKLYSLLSQTENIKSNINDLFNNIIKEINNGNMLTNPYYNYYNYTYIYSSILKLEEMYNNLYLVSDNFGSDNIRNIINNIRNNLDNSTCSMTYEYYVIKKSDCPRYSFILNEISSTTDYVYHCYVIQDLISSTKANYAASECNNDYINTAIVFIKEISNLLLKRIEQLKEIQNYYILTWNNIYSEMKSINNSLNSIQYLLNNEINNTLPMGNCSSVKFDLIDFSDFISNKIAYKIKIMIIFSALSGGLGFLLFYSVLLIIRRIRDNNYYKYKENSGYGNNLINNYSKLSQNNKKSKLRKIKPPYLLKSGDEFQNNNKNENINKGNLSWDINDVNLNKNNVVYNNIRKIEMRNLEKKNK